ncbi:hypothetical protein [Nocardioides sp. 503]|uniref:hypothetical protein n=1 Tax=Nocardioides sp. 503 TaxID=2508326 RepID=UPI00106F8C0A|nr:hypothetical protein [Nocardioides sp. 503]
MRLTLTVLAACVLVASGCSAEEQTREPPPEPTQVTLTGAERDDFIDRVVDLGYTCREAVPDTSAYVACTRPGRYPDAIADTVTIASSEDGEQVLGVAYCGPEAGVAPAFSEAFLGEVESPDLQAQVPPLEGVTLRSCRSAAGDGFRAGGRVPVLRQLELPRLRQSLVRRGWSCQDDEAAYCTLPGSRGGRTLVWGIPGEARVVAESAGELAEAATVLGLSPIVAEAATSCLTRTVCDHLLVDGFDLFFDTDARYHRMRVRERTDF